ncbi:hypothetical protein BU17DRAFT_60037 [Hysterangium stoloniferum]|nr:hypothetical protein BU17DRAFT_60037 [Hysterangium stoloniferum]
MGCLGICDVKSILEPNPKRNSRGPPLKNLATVEDTEKDNYEFLPTERGHFLTSRIILRLVIPPTQPFPVSHRRCPYPRRSAGEAAEPIPSTVIPSSFIPDATARIPRTHPNPPYHVQIPHRKSTRGDIDDEKARSARVLRIYILKVLRQQVKNSSRSRSLLSSSALRWRKSHGVCSARRGIVCPGKAACPRCEVGVPPQTCARVAAFPDIFVVHATNFLHVSGGYSLFNVCHGQGGRPFFEESSHPQPGQYLHPTPPRALHPGLTLASPVQSPLPPNLQCRPVRSHSLPVVVRMHYLLPGTRLLWLIGHVEVSGSNNPLMQSIVAPASDSGPEPSVE